MPPATGSEQVKHGQSGIRRRVQYSLALMGGNEFRPPCEGIDRALLEATRSPRPRVVVLPTAATPEDPVLAAKNGVEYFQRLGAMATACMILTRADAENPELLQPLLKGDLLYLTGGSPGYLLQTIRGTSAWRSIVEGRRKGRLIVGSSAGAMVLGAKMWEGSGWAEALGLVAGLALLPHGESLSRAQVASLTRNLDPGLTLFQIDTATCCVRLDTGHWLVLGEGQVRVHAAGKASYYKPGMRFLLAD